MDWHTRKRLARRVSKTFEADFRIEVPNDAIARFGPPEIMNGDLGSRDTSFAWTDRLRRSGMRISPSHEWTTGRVLETHSLRGSGGP